jgi:hypothetical protein
MTQNSTLGIVDFDASIGTLTERAWRIIVMLWEPPIVLTTIENGFEPEMRRSGLIPIEGIHWQVEEYKLS